MPDAPSASSVPMTALLKPAHAGVDTSTAQAAAAGLRTFFRLAEAWQLGIAEQTTLLGVARTTLYQWKQGKVGPLDRHQLERLSHLFGIYSALHILFPVAAPRRRMDPQAEQRAAVRAASRRSTACWAGRSPTSSSFASTSTRSAAARPRSQGGDRSEERAAGARVLASVVPADSVALSDRGPVRRDRRRGRPRGGVRDRGARQSADPRRDRRAAAGAARGARERAGQRHR